MKRLMALTAVACAWGAYAEEIEIPDEIVSATNYTICC